MTPMTMTPPLRRALSGLGILSLLVVVGCVPAPSVTTLPGAPAGTSSSLKIQGMLKTEIERAAVEPSPYHEVTFSRDADYYPVQIVPVEERARFEAQANFWRFYENPEKLVLDPENPDRFEITYQKDDPRVTHLAYYFDERENFASSLVVEGGDGVAVRVSFPDGEPRLAFPQPTSGPLTVRGSSPEMGVAIFESENESSVVQRRFTVAEDRITPIEGAKDAVVVFNVANLDGEPINGLAKDHIELRMYNPDSEWDDRDPRFFDQLEAIADGKYRIRTPFTPTQESGKLRFEVEVVNPGIPLDAKFYRR